MARGRSSGVFLFVNSDCKGCSTLLNELERGIERIGTHNLRELPILVAPEPPDVWGDRRLPLIPSAIQEFARLAIPASPYLVEVRDREIVAARPALSASSLLESLADPKATADSTISKELG